MRGYQLWRDVVNAHGGLLGNQVKPIGMTRADAARIRDAVERAGVNFMSWEGHYRLH